MSSVLTPARQPFGVLNDSKLRSLQSVKNRQNAITPSSAPSLKRRAPSPEISDSENVDPGLFDASSKRKRAAFEDDVSVAKQPRLLTKTVSPSSRYNTTTAPQTSTPRTEVVTKSSTTPASAPAAAGRSPTRVHGKYDRSQLKRRFVPPSLGAISPSLSIAAALRGTLAHKKSSRTRRSAPLLQEAQPKSWNFEIFEESEEHQDYRMSEWTMTQSSAALEISDDEGKSKSFSGVEKADRGKENIDPNEMSVTSAPVTRAAAAAAAAASLEVKQDDMKAEEPRTPLGDLNAADFYGEGLDATSVVVVHDDVPEETPVADDAIQQAHEEQSAVPVSAPVSEHFTFEARHEPAAEPQLDVTDIPDWARKASVDLAAEPHQNECFASVALDAVPADIDIWESESAKDENEPQEENQSPFVVVGEGQTISLSGGCLYEI